MADIFWYIGIFTVFCLATIAGFAILVFLYANLIHDRFSWIPFRKSQRRISIASWHQSKLMKKGEKTGDKTEWVADDFPICERPFYISYRLNSKSYFVLIGSHSRNSRYAVIKGEHP